MLKKIWKDPVGSKIIAEIIKNIWVLIFPLGIGIKSLIENIPFKTALREVLSYKISVLLIVGILITILIIVKLYKRYSLHWNKKKFIENNTKYHDEDNGILYRFSVEFEGYKPTIEQLDIYCTKHFDGTPIRYIDFKCPLQGCPNYKRVIDERYVINILESGLLGYWEDKKAPF